MSIGIVETKYGKVSGVELDGDFSGITYFKGIPYAAPPVGQLRWRPPADPEPWDGVRHCDSFGDAPVQHFDKRRLYYEFYEYCGLPPMSEDCLYINVCTAAQSADERRPVLMWFHGGGFTDGYAYENQYDPRVLAAKGVVVVSVGLRLGVFGYLSLPQLSAEQGGHSGNYAVMDQIKALDWVCENIAAFGGDPNCITAAGQSGGGTKAEVMATIPAAKGRVKRLIAQSGLRWYYKFTPQEKAEETGLRYLKMAGVDPTLSPDELRALDTYALFKADIDRFSMPGSIAQDMVTVPYADMREAFEAGAAGIDFMNGVNLGEAEIFAEALSGLNPVPVSENFNGPTITCVEEFDKHFKNLLGPLYDRYHFKELVPVTDENAWDVARCIGTYGLAGSRGPNIARSLMLDRMFGRYMAKLSPESRVYAYFWSQQLPIIDALKGSELDTAGELSWHTSEFWYTFASMREGVPPHRPWRDIDYQVADTTSSYWANFILTGDPNGPNGDGKLPYWPVTGDNYGWMELGETPQGHTGLENELDRLIRDYTAAEYHLDV